MPWPLSQDYNEAVQNSVHCFSDAELRQTEARCNAIGIPMPRSGNFADVYEMSGPGGKKWAVKCFTRQVPGLRERYAAISAHLKQVNLPFMVDFSYLERGINVKGQWYPILKMHWVEGFTLNQLVKEYADQPQHLEMLCQIWVRLARRLREARMAHCDLQHGNVLLVPGSTATSLAIRLIDYDGMFVPALATQQSGEVGHPAYQHPQRLRDGTYNAEVDRFPHLVICTALRALMVGSRYLWNKFDNGDNLLFRQQDLERPDDSALFKELSKLKDDRLQKLLLHLRAAVHKPLEQAPLLEELVPEIKPPSTTTRRKSGVVGTATPPAEQTAESIFAAATTGAEPSSSRIRPQRQPAKKSLVWAWAAGAVAAVALAGGIFMAVANRGSRDPKGGAAVVAQKDGGETGTVPEPTRKESPPRTQPKTEPKTEPKTPPPAEPKTEPRSEPQPTPDGELRRFGTEGTPVRNVAFSADGRNVLCNHGSRMIRYDAHTGAVLSRCNINGTEVAWACWLPGNQWGALFMGRVVTIFDAQTWGIVRELNNHQATVHEVSLSADGRRVLSGAGTLPASDCTARVWDVLTGKEVSCFTGHTRPVDHVALSPDGKRAVSSSSDLVCLWDADSGKETRRLGPLALVTALAFLPDSRQLLIADNDYNVRLWDVDANREVRRFDRQRSRAQSLAVSPDGRYAASGSGQVLVRDGQRVPEDCVVRLWEIATGKELRRYEGHTDVVHSVAISPDGRYVLSGGDTTARLWPLNPEPIVARPPETAPSPAPAAGRELRVFQGDFATTFSLAYSPDGRRALSAHSNCFCLWDVSSGTLVRRFPPLGGSVLKAVFLPDSRRALLAHTNRTLTVFDLDKGQAIRQMTVPSYFQSLAVSPDGRRVVTGSGAAVRKDGQTVRNKDGTVVNEDCIGRVWDVETGKELCRFERHKSPMIHLTLSPDGRRALSSSNDEHYLWDVDTGREIRQLHPGVAHRLVFCPDGRHVLISSGNQTVRLWDVETDKQVSSFHHVSNVIGLAVSPDGRYFLSGSGKFTVKDGKTTWSDCAVQLWELASGKELRHFEGHTCRPDHLAFSPDGRYALSAGFENTIRMWDLGLGGTTTGKPAVPPPVESRAAVPDAEAEQKARKLVKDLFKQDYARITKSADRAALAAKLIQKGIDTKDDPAARFVLFSEARDLAAQAADVAAVMKAIEHLAQGYAIDGIDMKLKALTTAAKTAISAPANKALAESCLAAVDGALALDNYEAALALLSVADPAAKKSKSAALSRRVPALLAEVREIQQEFASVQSAAQTLQKKPDDPEANLTTGRFLCLRKGDWNKGLAHLAAGSDAGLQALAKKDLARPATEAGQIEVGDGWWDLSATSSGTVKTHVQQRAAHWYEQALAAATGLTRDRLQARLKEADENAPKTSLPLQTGEVRRFSGHTARVNSVALSADGKRALSGGDDRSIRLWDVATGKELNSSRAFTAEVRAVALSPDGKYAVASSAHLFKVWEVENLRNLISHGLGNTPLCCLASLPDNQRFVGASGSGTPWLLDVVSDLSGRARAMRQTNRNPIHAVAVSADGRFAILGSANGIVQIYNLGTQLEERRLLGHKDDVLGVALSKDARQAVTAGADKTIRVWDAQTGKSLRTITGHEGRVTCVALTADGRRIISGSEDKTIRVWDSKTGRELRRLTGHTDVVTSVALSADGRHVLSGSADQSIRLWDISR